MQRTLLYSIVCILFLAFVISCTGGSNVVSPVTEPEMTIGTSSHTGQNQAHSLWGLWQFIADPEAGTLNIVQLRSGDMHLNALTFLEPPPLINLTLESIEFNGNLIEADIGLRHPFLGLTEFSGFDVCGVFITNGSVTGFDDPDLRMAGEGDTRLLNPDGYSRWWNPAEFPHDGTMFGYKDGFLGAPDSHAHYNSTLNAYKYFCDDLDPDDSLSDVTLVKRGMFSAGRKNVRHYTIEMGAGLIFNYAVDACWSFPEGDPPWTVPDDFALEANRVEAWRILVGELENTLWNDGTDSGGGLNLSIDVYDWFNADLNAVRIESPGNFSMVESASPIGGGAGYSTYAIEISSATPDEDEIEILISVISEGEDFEGFISGTNSTAYFTHIASVSSEQSNPVCNIQVVTLMPHNGWGLIEFDASGSEPVDPGDILTFAWDFDGDGVYGENPDDNYSGTSENPFHKYESNYVGEVWLKVSDDKGGESECYADVDVTAHKSKNITLRPGVRAYDIGVDPQNGDLWIGYKDYQIYKYTLAGWYNDPQYKYSVPSWSEFDRCDTAAGGSTFFIESSASKYNGYSCIYHNDGTGGFASGWGGAQNWLVDVANFGTTGNRANDLVLFVGYWHTSLSVYIILARAHHAPNYSFSPVLHGETWNYTYTGPTRVHHEYVKGMDTGPEGENLWFLEAPDYYCGAFHLTGASPYTTLSYNNSYFGAGSESTGDDCWTADVCDLAHDPDGTFHVLDSVSGAAVIKVFTPSSSGGQSLGHYGDSNSISGTPQRIDGSDYDGTIIVLHGDDTNGYLISVFLDDEQV